MRPPRSVGRPTRSPCGRPLPHARQCRDEVPVRAPGAGHRLEPALRTDVVPPLLRDGVREVRRRERALRRRRGTLPTTSWFSSGSRCTSSTPPRLRGLTSDAACGRACALQHGEALAVLGGDAPALLGTPAQRAEARCTARRAGPRPRCPEPGARRPRRGPSRRRPRWSPRARPASRMRRASDLRLERRAGPPRRPRRPVRPPRRAPAAGRSSCRGPRRGRRRRRPGAPRRPARRVCAAASVTSTRPSPTARPRTAACASPARMQPGRTLGDRFGAVRARACRAPRRRAPGTGCATGTAGPARGRRRAPRPPARDRARGSTGPRSTGGAPVARASASSSVSGSPHGKEGACSASRRSTAFAMPAACLRTRLDRFDALVDGRARRRAREQQLVGGQTQRVAHARLDGARVASRNRSSASSSVPSVCSVPYVRRVARAVSCGGQSARAQHRIERLRTERPALAHAAQDGERGATGRRDAHALSHVHVASSRAPRAKALPAHRRTALAERARRRGSPRPPSRAATPRSHDAAAGATSRVGPRRARATTARRPADARRGTVRSCDDARTRRKRLFDRESGVERDVDRGHLLRVRREGVVLLGPTSRSRPGSQPSTVASASAPARASSAVRPVGGLLADRDGRPARRTGRCRGPPPCA